VSASQVKPSVATVVSTSSGQAAVGSTSTIGRVDSGLIRYVVYRGIYRSARHACMCALEWVSTLMGGWAGGLYVCSS
jgi:hypothetical protein